MAGLPEDSDAIQIYPSNVDSYDGATCAIEALDDLTRVYQRITGFYVCDDPLIRTTSLGLVPAGRDDCHVISFTAVS